jgi:hypothetical protein
MGFPATANQTINSEIVARIASGLQALRSRSDDCSQKANSVALTMHGDVHKRSQQPLASA